MNKLSQIYIDQIIKNALAEDITYIDITTENLISKNHVSDAVLIAKDDGIICGLDVFVRVFELIQSNFELALGTEVITPTKSCQNGDVILSFSGNTRTLLKGERTALNLLQHMSGIATYTAKCVKAVKGTGIKIVDTRKTLPGLRALQKYAVTCGGGFNHRFNLSDGAMIKDNHIEAAGGIIPAVKTLREKLGHMVKIEVEVTNADELEQAFKSGADVILLDNMTPAQMRDSVLRKNAAGVNPLLEASGNANLENIREIAETGVDVISLGMLTHSVKAFDISMRISAH